MLQENFLERIARTVCRKQHSQHYLMYYIYSVTVLLTDGQCSMHTCYGSPRIIVNFRFDHYIHIISHLKKVCSVLLLVLNSNFTDESRWLNKYITAILSILLVLHKCNVINYIVCVLAKTICPNAWHIICIWLFILSFK